MLLIPQKCFITIPKYITGDNLQPFNFKIFLYSRDWSITVPVVTSSGTKSETYSNSASYYSTPAYHILIEFDVAHTLSAYLERDSSKQLIAQFSDVSNILPIVFTLPPNSMINFYSCFHARTMSISGIESQAEMIVWDYLQGNNFTQALEVLNNVLSDEVKIGHNPKLYLLRAYAYAGLNLYDDAIKDASTVIMRSNYSNYDAYYLRGICLLELGNFNGIGDLERAGTKGSVFLKQHNISSATRPSVPSDSLSLHSEIIKSIPVSNKNIILSPQKIFAKYKDAVFTIFTSSINGTSQGSGFFISEDGLAVSNFHVFNGAIQGSEQIHLSDGSIKSVQEIIAFDKEKDFIIFRVAGNGFTKFPITKRGFSIGDKVFAIGTPKGMSNTLSDGLVSQIWDDVKFQISVPIDHGSSGGALINQYGEVIGITSGGRDDTHANLNYAIDIRNIFK